MLRAAELPTRKKTMVCVCPTCCREGDKFKKRSLAIYSPKCFLNWYLSCTQHTVPSTQYPVHSTQHTVSSTQYPVPQYPVPQHPILYLQYVASTIKKTPRNPLQVELEGKSPRSQHSQRLRAKARKTLTSYSVVTLHRFQHSQTNAGPVHGARPQHCAQVHDGGALAKHVMCTKKSWVILTRDAAWSGAHRSCKGAQFKKRSLAL